MYRKRIILDGDSDATAILARVGVECRAAGLSTQDTETVISHMSSPLHALIDSGNAVASAGGQFRARREIRTDGAILTLIARYGVPPGVLARLWRVLSGGR